jgi:hypothetical protein
MRKLARLMPLALLLVALAACTQPPVRMSPISEKDSDVVFKGGALGLTRVSGEYGQTYDYEIAVDREFWRNPARPGNFAVIHYRQAGPGAGVFDNDVTSMVRDFLGPDQRAQASFGATGTASSPTGQVNTVALTLTKTKRYCIGFKKGLGLVTGAEYMGDAPPANMLIGLYCDSQPLAPGAADRFFANLGVKGFGVPN